MVSFSVNAGNGGPRVAMGMDLLKVYPLYNLLLVLLISNWDVSYKNLLQHHPPPEKTTTTVSLHIRKYKHLQHKSEALVFLPHIDIKMGVLDSVLGASLILRIINTLNGEKVKIMTWTQII